MMLDFWRNDLAALNQRNRMRSLASNEGLDFASNDYLALAQSPELRQIAFQALERGAPIGAAGSRLLRGNHPEHEMLETEAAIFFGSETALFFGAGFAANEALLATLTQPVDVIFFDDLIHASFHDGMRLSRAPYSSFPHNDATALDKIICDWRYRGGIGKPWIIVESLYSMDGDFSPLEDLLHIADRHEAFLIIDDAHATGVYGSAGRGLTAPFEGRENVISVHTCGKALGVSGALVCLARPLREFLINRARNFIFATAPSPLLAACVRDVLKLVSMHDERRALLSRNIEKVRLGLSGFCNLTPTSSQIQPVIVGSDHRALALSRRLREQGYDVRAIRPPTVAEGSARLRISVTLNVNEEQISQMIKCLSDMLGKEKL